jgi:hypothetical protein
MSVDYDANFGVCVKVMDDYDEDEYDDACEYFEEILDGTDYEYGEVGNSFGGNMEYYIFIGGLFKDGYDVSEKIKEFEEFLKRKGISYTGKIDICGGVHVW